MKRKLKTILKRIYYGNTRVFLLKDLLYAGYLSYKKVENALARNDNKTVSRLYLRLKNVERHLRGAHSFLTIDELVVWTNDWIKSFPSSYDIIIGVPRSGLMIANIIALKLGKPLSTPDNFSNGNYWIGKRMIDDIEKKDCLDVLLIEDSIRQEKSINESLELLHYPGKKLNITKAALLVSEDAKDCVDLYYKVLTSYPATCEWNLLHWKRGKLAVDLDGVICEDCPPEIDANEKRYVNWLKNARPYLIPNFEIDVIVSSRLEKYRLDTVTWLTEHSVRYIELYLWNIQSKAEREGRFAEHKIDILCKIKPQVYWESDYGQAKDIWKTTRIPTICISEMIAFGVL